MIKNRHCHLEVCSMGSQHA